MAPDTNQWRCSQCHGTNVELCLRAWFTADDLQLVEIDIEDRHLGTYCADCKETHPIWDPHQREYID